MSRKVFVVIPVYKGERFVETAVRSVLGQKGLETAVILVEDGSPDQSGQICDALARKLPNVQVLHRENGGPSVARNAGIQMALTQAGEDDYIAFLDADDFWLDLGHEVGLDGDLMGWSCAACSENGSRFRILRRFQDGRMALSGANSRWFDFGTFAAFFYRAGLVRKYSLGFMPGVRGNEDVIFWRQAFFCARSVSLRSGFLYVYRQHPASATHSVQYDALHIPDAWRRAASWVDGLACFSQEEKERWRQACERTCGARLLESARLMVARGCDGKEIQDEILDGPLGGYLTALVPEDLAQWQRKDLELLQKSPQALIRRHRWKGILLSLGQILLRFPPIRLLREWRRFPLHSIQ